MMVHRLRAIWGDPVRKNAGGKMGTSCQIWDTQKGAFDGHRAVFKASITSWSESFIWQVKTQANHNEIFTAVTQLVACIMLHMKTKL